MNEDNIRNFAHGCGDDNSLYCDPHYVAGTRWGSMIAPAMMVTQINKLMLGDPLPEEIKALCKSPFRGIHAFVSGSQWNFYRPVFPGDTIYSFNGMRLLKSRRRNLQENRLSLCAAM